MKNIELIGNVRFTLNELTETLVENEIGYLHCCAKKNLPEEEVAKLFADAKKKMINELLAYHKFALGHIYSNTNLELEDYASDDDVEDSE